ncbi:hypothetical protein PVAP13_6NG007393, partial [Panicum virgatum]
MASDDDELLQDGAAVLEQEGEVPSVDGDGAEAELPEAGEEHGAGREGAPGSGWAVHEDELPGALGREELEAARELVPVRGQEGAWVRGGRGLGARRGRGTRRRGAGGRRGGHRRRGEGGVDALRQHARGAVHERGDGVVLHTGHGRHAGEGFAL